jgi:hypothetical protein
MRILARFALVGLVGLAACGGPNGCDEFAAPESRRPSTCPPKPLAQSPPRETKYCYQSLGQIDCYDEPQMGRSLYMGSTTEQ